MLTHIVYDFALGPQVPATTKTQLYIGYPHLKRSL